MNSYYEKIDNRAPICIDGEIGYDIPEGWAWTRLRDLFHMQAGTNRPANSIAYDRTEDTPFPCFGGNGIRGYVNEANWNGEYPIIGRQGALCGNVNLAIGPFFATEHAVVVEAFSGISCRWACLALAALNLNQYSTSTAQPGLAIGTISNVMIAVPPVNEGHRIYMAFSEISKSLDINLRKNGG